ncbi:MAG: PEP-CTERM sorting domain-containing protein [Fimbriimonadaceae bacterium]|nr:PEP-CTERM sorting domain-containing protein [Fimbriimonadaceae bacterium]
MVGLRVAAWSAFALGSVGALAQGGPTLFGYLQAQNDFDGANVSVGPVILDAVDGGAVARLNLNYGTVRSYAQLVHADPEGNGIARAESYFEDTATFTGAGLSGSGTAVARVDFSGRLDAGALPPWEAQAAFVHGLTVAGEFASADGRVHSAFGVTGDPNGFLELPFAFTWGEPFQIRVSNMVSAMANIGHAEADFESTVQWTGISDVRDSGGNLVTPDVTSGTGLNWLNPVPEPMSLAALAIGAGGLLRRRRR